MKRVATMLCWLGCIGIVDRLVAQDQAIGVFLDCQTMHCDFDHFRREIRFVNWVRDRQDADVHILGTSQETGGGGREFTFTFIGLRAFAGRTDTLRYVSSNTDTGAEVRDGLVQTLRLGVVPYVAATPLGRRLRIGLDEREAEVSQTGAAQDPWNLWVFTMGVGGSLDGEQRERNRSFDGQLEANRTAENLKLEFNVSGELEHREQDLADEGEPPAWFVNTTHSVFADQRAVWSLGDHWSLGVRSAQSSSTFFNQEFTIRGGPAIEYSLYRYAESTRRQLTFLYAVETASFNYEDETIFDKLAEVLPAHRLDINLEIRQPWGVIESSLETTQFLHDLAKHRINLGTELDLRIFRGFELSLEAGVSRIKDQLFLAKRDLTPEEILIRRRQLGTDYRYETGIRFQYRFGSRIANVVNPRMQE